MNSCRKQEKSFQAPLQDRAKENFQLPYSPPPQELISSSNHNHSKLTTIVDLTMMSGLNLPWGPFLHSRAADATGHSLPSQWFEQGRRSL